MEVRGASRLGASPRQRDVTGRTALEPDGDALGGEGRCRCRTPCRPPSPILRLPPHPPVSLGNLALLPTRTFAPRVTTTTPSTMRYVSVDGRRRSTADRVRGSSSPFLSTRVGCTLDPTPSTFRCHSSVLASTSSTSFDLSSSPAGTVAPSRSASLSSPRLSGPPHVTSPLPSLRVLPAVPGRCGTRRPRGSSTNTWTVDGDSGSGGVYGSQLSSKEPPRTLNPCKAGQGHVRPPCRPDP